MNKISLAAWSALLISLGAWAGVGYFAWQISLDEEARIIEIANSQQNTAKGASATRLHALAQETTEEREKLDEILKPDVVEIANMIEDIGKAARVSLTLGNAQPENSPQSDTSLQVYAVGFVVQADGTFAALLHAAKLLETLPAPSAVRRLDIERVQGQAGWHLNAYVRILTTTDISS